MPHPRLAAAALLASALLLGGCGDEILMVCDLCAGEDPNRLVAPGNVPRIDLIGDRRLPASATNVHFAERCGMDCSQYLRADLPLADARAFAASLLGGGRLRPGESPWPGDMKRSIVFAVLPWWPTAFPAGFEGGETTGRDYPPAEIVLVPRGAMATIWLKTFET